MFHGELETVATQNMSIDALPKQKSEPYHPPTLPRDASALF